MTSTFEAFISSAQKVLSLQTGDAFYIYPDKWQQPFPIPATLDDAYGDGYLVIELHSDLYYLQLENQLYTDSNLLKLEAILFNWGISEGYIWQ